MNKQFGGGGSASEMVDNNEKDSVLKEGWQYDKLRVDIKALEAFERHLKLQGKIEEVYVPHGMDNVAINRAFPDAKITFLEETKTEVEKHERYGHTAIRGHAETHRGEKVSLVALFDTKVNATWQLTQNVEQHGYLICRARHAPAVLKAGKFEIKGVIKMRSIGPAFETNQAKFGQIEKDKDFENAEHVAGAVTFEEIRKTVIEAFPGTKEDFVEKYKELITQAKEQNGKLTAAHTPVLKWKSEAGGQGVELDINTILPPKKDDETLWVFRKWNV